MSKEEYEKIPKISRDIMHKYVTSMQVSRKVKSDITVKNNVAVVRFMLRNIKKT